MSQAPLFTFGIVADVQYSDLEDGQAEGRVQRYREAPSKLLAVVKHWVEQKDISFAISLGDVINGNKDWPERNVEELETVAAIFDQLASIIPLYHVVGNHCLSVPRSHLLSRLSMPASYYSVRLPANWQLIVLDTTEMSGHSGFPEGSKEVAEAVAFREAHPVSPENPQMSDWNGGISSKQLRWLGEELRQAEEAGRKVMLAAHHQAGKGGARSTHLAWNWPDIHSLLTASGCAKLYMAGHDHMGGYAFDGGVHWLTVEAILEAPSGGNAYAVVKVYSDRLEIEGQGVKSRSLVVQ